MKTRTIRSDRRLRKCHKVFLRKMVAAFRGGRIGEKTLHSLFRKKFGVNVYSTALRRFLRSLVAQ